MSEDYPNPYTEGPHNPESGLRDGRYHSIHGPSVGPDTVFGYYASLAFKTEGEAMRMAELANAAFRAGRRSVQDEINKALGR